MDKGAVTFVSSVNSRIFLVGSKPRNDEGRGFSWFWEEVVQVGEIIHNLRQSASLSLNSTEAASS